MICNIGIQKVGETSNEPLVILLQTQNFLIIYQNYIQSDVTDLFFDFIIRDIYFSLHFRTRERVM